MNMSRSFFQRMGDYKNPILKPGAAAKVKRDGEIQAEGKTFHNPSSLCLPQSPPYIWRSMGAQLLQETAKVTIIYWGTDALARHVRLNASHPAQVVPSWSGDSIGRYEGDTLVVDTVGIKTGPYSMVDNYGTPQSAALHLTERFRLIDGDMATSIADESERVSGRILEDRGAIIIDREYKGMGLQVALTVEDPNVFTMPWSATVTYRRAKSGWEEMICADNPRDYSTGADAPIPKADMPDF
jgi:hypothetical protein